MSDARYTRLKSPWQLRGWQGLPYALVNPETGAVLFLREDWFRTLGFCNGRFCEDSPVFLGERTEHLSQLDELGLLECLDEPGNLDATQAYKLYPNRFIRQIHWSITGHCNYRCRHCYMGAPHAALPQPSHEECLRIIDQMAACGVPFVSLTGGEPLVRGDFLELVDAILAHDMHISLIMTNGALVSEELLCALKERSVTCEFNMSFDGTEGWHDWLRGVDGAEKSVRRAFELCREHGFITGAEMVLHKGNRHTLRDSVRFLAEAGVTSLKVNRLNCVGEGTALKDYELSCAEEFETYLDYIPHYFEDGMPIEYLMLSGLFTARKGKFFNGYERHAKGSCASTYVCKSARNMMYLGPDGRVLPCIPMSETQASQERFPTLGEMSLEEALSDSFYLDFITTGIGTIMEHNPECSACEYRFSCGGGCRGRATVMNGGSDLLAADPDACLFFKGGYRERLNALING